MNETLKTVPQDVDEKEAAEVLTIFRGLPAEKRAVVIAFLNGMETQKAISETKATI